MPTHDEFERLRRVAYSRAGTPDDLRRLAELERPPSEDAESGVEDEAVPVARRRTGLIVVAAIAGLVGAAAGAAVTGMLTMRQTPAVVPEAEASPEVRESLALEVFDRPPTSDDDPANLDHWMDRTAFEDIELRLLEQHDDTRFYALRGARWGLEEVCLAVESPSTSAMSCAAIEQFLLRGITMRTGDIVARWDPASQDVRFGASS